MAFPKPCVVCGKRILNRSRLQTKCHVCVAKIKRDWAYKISDETKEWKRVLWAISNRSEKRRVEHEHSLLVNPISS